MPIVLIIAVLFLMPSAPLLAGEGVAPAGEPKCFAALRDMRGLIAKYEEAKKTAKLKKQICRFLEAVDTENPEVRPCFMPMKQAEQLNLWKDEVRSLAVKRGVQCPRRTGMAFVPARVAAEAALPTALAGASGTADMRGRLDEFYSNARKSEATVACSKGPVKFFASMKRKAPAPECAPAPSSVPKAGAMADVPPVKAFKAPLKKAAFYRFMDAIEDAALRAILSHEKSKKIFLRVFGVETKTLYRGINKYDMEKLKANNWHYPQQLLYKFATPDKSVAAAYAKQKEGCSLIQITTSQAIPYYKLTRFWNFFAKMGEQEYIYLTDGSEEIIQLPLQ